MKLVCELELHLFTECPRNNHHSLAAYMINNIRNVTYIEKIKKSTYISTYGTAYTETTKPLTYRNWLCMVQIMY